MKSISPLIFFFFFNYDKPIESLLIQRIPAGPSFAFACLNISQHNNERKKGQEKKKKNEKYVRT